MSAPSHIDEVMNDGFEEKADRIYEELWNEPSVISEALGDLASMMPHDIFDMLDAAVVAWAERVAVEEAGR